MIEIHVRICSHFCLKNGGRDLVYWDGTRTTTMFRRRWGAIANAMAPLAAARGPPHGAEVTRHVAWTIPGHVVIMKPCHLSLTFLLSHENMWREPATATNSMILLKVHLKVLGWVV